MADFPHVVLVSQPPIPPSSPIFTAHTHPSKEFSYAADVPSGTPHQLRRRPEPVTSTPTEPSTSVSDMQNSKVSPRRVGLQGPSDGISPVAEEEVISTEEDDVFDGKTEAPENTEQSEKQGTNSVRNSPYTLSYFISVIFAIEQL